MHSKYNNKAPFHYKESLCLTILNILCFVPSRWVMCQVWKRRVLLSLLNLYLTLNLKPSFIIRPPRKPPALKNPLVTLATRQTIGVAVVRSNSSSNHSPLLFLLCPKPCLDLPLIIICPSMIQLKWRSATRGNYVVSHFAIHESVMTWLKVNFSIH